MKCLLLYELHNAGCEARSAETSNVQPMEEPDYEDMDSTPTMTVQNAFHQQNIHSVRMEVNPAYHKTAQSSLNKNGMTSNVAYGIRNISNLNFL